VDTPLKRFSDERPDEVAGSTTSRRSQRLALSFRNSGERLVRELGPDLLRRAESLGLDPEESQDVVQDCFADLWRRQPDPAVVVSWLFRVVRWRALDRIRSEARRQSAEARAAEAQNPSAEEDPEESLALREAVAALPSRERRAIQARFVAGATVAEAGARAGWKPSSAKKLFARARARLKRLI
jgi:RNA polymerase sigma-70 factor (ECF subfamily)